MDYLINYSIFESKNYQNLYHILTLSKLKYVIKHNKMRPFNASNGTNISMTRDKMMNGYLGDGPLTFFKLEFDGVKLSQNYKIKPFSYKSRNGIRFDEKEEMIKTRNGSIDDIDKYVTKLIILKNNIEPLKEKRRGNLPSDFFTTAGTGSGTIPSIIKDIVETSPFEIYVQDGSVIKKDDDYINSLINYELLETKFLYDVWYRGNFPFPKIKYATKDTLINKNGDRFSDWAIGEIFDEVDGFDTKEEINTSKDKKIIDGIECTPYLMKFRIVDDGYYLQDVRPL